MMASGFVVAQDAPDAPPYLLVADGRSRRPPSVHGPRPWSPSSTPTMRTLMEPRGRRSANSPAGPMSGSAFFHGFSKMADLDDWTPNRRILVDVLGPVEGGAVKDALARGVDSSDRVMTLVEELSRPWIGAEPPKYLWVATVRVADGKMTEYAALAKRVRRAFDDHAEELHWLCYANVIGGESSELVYYYGFDAFAEVDSWPSRREVLAAALGERDGGRLASAVEAITETTTSLWRLEPELSRLSGE